MGLLLVRRVRASPLAASALPMPAAALVYIPSALLAYAVCLHLR